MKHEPVFVVFVFGALELTALGWACEEVKSKDS